MIKWDGRLGCDAANISVISTEKVGAVNSGFSLHHIIILPYDGEYEVTLNVRGGIDDVDLLVTKTMVSESGMFYVGDWCYTNLEYEQIHAPDGEEIYEDWLMICNMDADGEYEVTVTVKEVD